MKKRIALILNFLLVIFEVAGFYITYKVGEIITPALYTEDSNFICLIGSLLYVIYHFNGKTNNKVVNLLRFVSTLNLIITFTITLFLLTNEFGFYGIMIKDEFIFFHTLCPIISTISYLFFEKYTFTKNSKFMIKAPIFTLIYGFVVYLLNFLRLLDGPYYFLKVYENPVINTVITFFGTMVAVYTITFALLEIKKKIKI